MGGQQRPLGHRVARDAHFWPTTYSACVWRGFGCGESGTVNATEAPGSRQQSRLRSRGSAGSWRSARTEPARGLACLPKAAGRPGGPAGSKDGRTGRGGRPRGTAHGTAAVRHGATLPGRRRAQLKPGPDVPTTRQHHERPECTLALRPVYTRHRAEVSETTNAESHVVPALPHPGTGKLFPESSCPGAGHAPLCSDFPQRAAWLLKRVRLGPQATRPARPGTETAEPGCTSRSRTSLRLLKELGQELQ